MSAATDLRDQGMENAENAADMRVVAIIDALIALANDSGEEWSANTIRDQLPTTESQGLVGARVRAAAMRKPAEMVRVGWTESDLPSTHSAVIRVWRGVTA